MNHIAEMLEETLYQYYKERHPIVIATIKQLLIQGEKPNVIKKKCEEVIGRNKTSNNLSFVVDYINKHINN